jgi:uncharacterized membrane protein YkoI
MRKNTLLLAACAASIATVTAWAADNTTDGRAVETAAQARETLPMEDIIQRARTAQPGEIRKVELEHKRGRLLYEVDVVAENGVKKELKFDAATGELVSNKDDDDDGDDD